MDKSISDTINGSDSSALDYETNDSLYIFCCLYNTLLLTMSGLVSCLQPQYTSNVLNITTDLLSVTNYQTNNGGILIVSGVGTTAR